MNEHSESESFKTIEQKVIVRLFVKREYFLGYPVDLLEVLQPVKNFPAFSSQFIRFLKKILGYTSLIFYIL